MSKPLKIEDEVYYDLTQEKVGNETYSQVIARLLDILRMLRGIEPKLRGHTAYQEFKSASEAQQEAANR